MNPNEVLTIARREVEARGWPWLEPVRVVSERRWLIVGAVKWHVLTNADKRGSNAVVILDDATGAVVSCSYAPR